MQIKVSGEIQPLLRCLMNVVWGFETQSNHYGNLFKGVLYTNQAVRQDIISSPIWGKISKFCELEIDKQR